MSFRDIAARVGTIVSELDCPICLSTSTDAVILQPCGHLGCAEHIDEWLSRKNQCPVCRAEVAGKAVKSHVLDSVLAKLLALQDATEKASLDNALRRSASTDGDIDTTVSESSALTNAAVAGVERLFRNHIKEALDACSRYVVEMGAERDAAVKAAQQEYESVRATETAAAATAAATDVFAALAPKPADLAPSTAVITAGVKRDAAIAAATNRFNEAVTLLQTDVSVYLSTAVPSVSLMPATITVSVPSLPIRLDVRLRPTDTINSTVIPAIKKAMAETARKETLDFSAGATWSWQDATVAAAGAASAAIGVAASGGAGTAGAAAGGTAVGGAAAMLSSTGLAADTPVLKQLPWAGATRPTHGLVLVCTGTVVAAAAPTAQCLSTTWTAGSKHDYWWCTTCNLRWVCSGCAESCHKAKGHTLTPFLKQHVPTFACCYCKTRGGGNCTLPSAAPVPPAVPREPERTPVLPVPLPPVPVHPPFVPDNHFPPVPDFPMPFRTD